MADRQFRRQSLNLNISSHNNYKMNPVFQEYSYCRNCSVTTLSSSAGGLHTIHDFPVPCCISFKVEVALPSNLQLYINYFIVIVDPSASVYVFSSVSLTPRMAEELRRLSVSHLPRFWKSY